MHRPFRADTLEKRTLFATSLVSVDTAGGVGDGDSFNASLSADGRFVAFASQASDLVAGDGNGLEDTFLRDRQSAATTLVSVAQGGGPANGETVGEVAVSTDGRFVAFASAASNLVADDTNGEVDVFLRDVQAGTTTRVSVAPGGGEATGGGSTTPSVSDDGRLIVFQSSASNLVTNDLNSAGDVFVRNLDAGTTTLVTARPDGQPAQAGGGNAVISGDGRFVAFESSSADFGTADTNGTFDVYVRDLAAGQTSRVSVGLGGASPNDASSSPSINGDGRFVVFSSSASNLVPGQSNDDDESDVFVRDRVAGTTTLVSVAAGGTAGGNGSSSASRGGAISADGRFVVFQSSATDLIAGQTINRGVFVRDLQQQTTTLAGAPAVTIPLNESVSDSAISGDGATIALATMASNVIPGDVGGFTDVFVETNPPTPLPLPQVSVASASVSEGNGNTPGVVSFVVQLSHTFLAEVNVSYATSDGTASAGSDYQPASGSITIPAGQTTAQVNVSALGDAVFEPDETFALTLSNATNATLAAMAQATGTIANDEPEPPPTPPGPLAPTVLARLPASAVTGRRVRGAAASVNVVNDSGVDFSEECTVKLFFAPQMNLDAGGAVEVGNVTRDLRLRAGKSRVLRFRIAQFPAVPDGDYFLVARVDGPAGTLPRVGAFDTSIALAAPFVDLSSTALVARAAVGRGKNARVALALRNDGNVPAIGSLGVRVFASTDAALSGDDADLGLLKSKLNVKPGATRTADLRLTVPQELAPGIYRLIAVIDADAAIAESDEGNNVIAAAVDVAVM